MYASSLVLDLCVLPLSAVVPRTPRRGVIQLAVCLLSSCSPSRWVCTWSGLYSLCPQVSVWTALELSHIHCCLCVSLHFGYCLFPRVSTKLLHKPFAFAQTLFMFPDRIYWSIMDSAEEADVHRILRQQLSGALLGRRQEEITASQRAFSELSLQLTQLTERLDRFQINPPAAPIVAPLP